jgi:ATPase family associated with various cellular activities (AAA)
VTDESNIFDRVGTQRRQERAVRNDDDTETTAAAPVSKEDSPNTTTFIGGRRWQSNGDYFWNANLTLETLPAGLYRAMELANVGTCVEKIKVNADNLINFPDSPSAAVIGEIQKFWELEEEFKKRGFLHKRGVLLAGAPGGGKTSTLQQLISIVVKDYDGIAIFLDHPRVAANALQMVRRIEPIRPIVGLLEDLDSLVETYGESLYLSLLDGETQVSNIVFVATTNYPERLDPRFIDRPSRFDVLREIGMPSAEARRIFLRTRESSFTEAELDEWVKRTEGFSIAHLREMIILCRCYGKSLNDAVKRMEKMRDRVLTSRGMDDGRSSKVGFHSNKKRKSDDDIFDNLHSTSSDIVNKI